MYINPFVCGVIFTIIVEIILILIAAYVTGTKKDNNNKS